MDQTTMPRRSRAGRALALFLIVCSVALGAQAAIPASQRAVLVALYASTNGASWTQNTNWNGPSGTECTWYGITCDAAHDNVVVINLAANGLNGTLPPISDLSALNFFNVSGNHLLGDIPQLAGLASLQVFLVQVNQLSGPLPSLAGLTALNEFSAQGNQLTGTIPPFSTTMSLGIFRVESNQLSGPVPRPPASLVAGGSSSLCLNNLSSSGDAGIDSAWDTATAVTGTNWLACQYPPSAPPTCSLSAVPAAITLGESSTLTAICSPAAASYAWSANAGFGSATGSVSPATTTTYTVTGTNAAGTGNTASVTVSVVASTTPACDIVVSKASIAAGTRTTLTAVCNPAPSGYAWSVASCGSSVSCIVAPSQTTTYSVAGINDSGRGAAALAVVTVVPQPFPLTVTSNITAANANASVQLQAAQGDSGTTASIFIFAQVPRSLLGNKDGGPDPCVLAQLDPAGATLAAVTPETMRPYSTGVLGAQAQSVPILTNVPTTRVAGASFLVGYGPSANAMIGKGTYQGAVSVPGAVECTTAIAASAAPHAAAALSGLWWNAAESGWGIHFTQRGNVVFAAWFTYDTAGNPKWLVSTCNMPGTGAATSGTCTGPLLEVSARGFFGVPFDARAVNAITVGDLQVRFEDVDTASMSYTVRGQSRTVAITREPLASESTPLAVAYTDLWWNPTESGWGMAMTQQSGTTFLAWYVYGPTGKPMWYVATCTMSGSRCTGTLFRTTGPAFAATFNPAEVRATPVGTISVDFTDANNANITYTVNGVTASKSVTRQLF